LILSNNKKTFESKFDPLDQIRLLRAKCINISSSLYEVNAFYLDELRKIISQAIKTSLLTIITAQIRNDSGFSTIKSRQRFQLQIDKIVSKNISLLTIEHLNELAKTLDEENLRLINNAKDEMTKALYKKDSEKFPSNFRNESIHLSYLPPLENLSIIDGWKGDIKAPYSIEDRNDYITGETNQISSVESLNQNINESQLDDEKVTDTFDLKGNEIDILQSIFDLADESNSNDLDLNKEDSFPESNSSVDLVNNRLLPDSPIGLYEWMISIDKALIRRLRDLSHEINGELLRSGLINTLVPLNILDAALTGQLVSNKSISNVLTLKLPVSSPFAGGGGIDIDCLLITPSDLEFDSPQLRKSRTNIKHYQNLLIGMIKQQRYWQGRSLAEEVSKRWWKDTTKI
tara:strand:+ start:1352 stop:2557 length:1206 start_codon:yes stop_codon:yes gene_type:complete